MKSKHTLIVLIVLTAIFSLAFLLMLAVCITMKIEYAGQRMGNEAYGFYAAAFALTCIIGLPTALCWVLLVKRYKANKNATR